jgi:hypothetical protein
MDGGATAACSAVLEAIYWLHDRWEDFKQLARDERDARKLVTEVRLGLRLQSLHTRRTHGHSVLAGS